MPTRPDSHPISCAQTRVNELCDFSASSLFRSCCLTSSIFSLKLQGRYKTNLATQLPPSSAKKELYRWDSGTDLFSCQVAVKTPSWLGKTLMVPGMHLLKHSVQFSSVHSHSHVRLFVTPWTAARRASLSITNSWSLLKLMSIESVIPSNHLILYQPSSPPAVNLF